MEVAFTPEAKAILRRYEERLVDADKERGRHWAGGHVQSIQRSPCGLSLIIARSMGQESIGLDAMQWSIDYVEHYATETIKMFKANMADGPFDACCKAVFTKIETAGLAGITESQITRSVGAFANMDRRKRGGRSGRSGKRQGHRVP